MTKIKPSASSCLRDYVRLLRRDVFTTDGTISLCKICNIKIADEKKCRFSNAIIYQEKIII